MRIILSPAKKMNISDEGVEAARTPIFLHRTEEILEVLKSMSLAELKKLWGCNDRIAEQNLSRIEVMEPEKAVSPAILSYDGIAFKYMAPLIFENRNFDYVEEHLRILSGFYGVLSPLDAVCPYRLEMQAKLSVGGFRNLYDFWGRSLYDEVRDESGIIINLASKEYSACIEKYLSPEDIFITCVFGELSSGKVVQKGTYAKMARGEMVRFMAENNITDPENIKEYKGLGYSYNEEYSGAREFVFIK